MMHQDEYSKRVGQITTFIDILKIGFDFPDQVEALFTNQSDQLINAFKTFSENEEEFFEFCTAHLNELSILIQNNLKHIHNFLNGVQDPNLQKIYKAYTRGATFGLFCNALPPEDTSRISESLRWFTGREIAQVNKLTSKMANEEMKEEIKRQKGP